MTVTTPDGSALLSRYSRPASWVFDLLGLGVVDLTAAVGWALSNSPSLMTGLLEALHLDARRSSMSSPPTRGPSPAVPA